MCHKIDRHIAIREQPLDKERLRLPPHFVAKDEIRLHVVRQPVEEIVHNSDALACVKCRPSQRDARKIGKRVLLGI